MKKIILLAVISLGFFACQKAGTNPKPPVAIAKDTIPDTAYFKVQMVKDSTSRFGVDEVLIHFDHKAHLYFSPSYGGDAPTPGYSPNFSLLAISSDGSLLIEYGVPYSEGMSIPLFVSALNGPYLIKISLLKKIPASIHIWCKDNYLKDSLDLRKGNYNFSVNRADTSSFGKKRFQIILRPQ